MSGELTPPGLEKSVNRNVLCSAEKKRRRNSGGGGALLGD